MPESLEVDLAGAVLRLELSDVGEPASDAEPVKEDGDRPQLPEGFGTVTPVASRRGRGPAVIATEGLRLMLSPLGPLLEEVHRSVTSVPEPPREVSVTFGIQVGQDLKLGVVGANGQATMTVSATWDVNDARGD